MRKHMGSTKKPKAFKDAEALQMLEEYREHWSMQAVADLHPEYSYSTICNRVRSALDAQMSLAADHYRKIQDDKLDMLTEKIMPRLASLDDHVFFQAVAAILRVEERRSKLHGMDAPTQHVVQQENVVVSKETKKVVAMIQDRMATLAAAEGPPVLRAVER